MSVSRRSWQTTSLAAALGFEGPRWISLRLGGELIRHDLQLLAVVLRQFQILRIRPDGLDRPEGVNDTDRVFVGVLTGGLGEDLVDELAKPPTRVPTPLPPTSACP